MYHSNVAHILMHILNFQNLHLEENCQLQAQYISNRRPQQIRIEETLTTNLSDTKYTHTHTVYIYIELHTCKKNSSHFLVLT